MLWRIVALLIDQSTINILTPYFSLWTGLSGHYVTKLLNDIPNQNNGDRHQFGNIGLCALSFSQEFRCMKPKKFHQWKATFGNQSKIHIRSFKKFAILPMKGKTVALPAK